MRASRRKRLLITDLDNTLYDWVTFFASAFGAMVAELVLVLGVDEPTILSEFKTVHQHYGNSEQPFAVLELPSVRQKFGHLSMRQIREKLDPALHAFNSVRKKTLALYPTVEQSLQQLNRLSVTIVGHTEAIVVNACFRLHTLQLVHRFRRLYALEGKLSPHPDSNRQIATAPPIGFVEAVAPHERKPNPALLLDICKREGIPPEEAVYVGDSLTRDISMAKLAGVTAVWARYGTRYDRECWNLLVRVTHWTDDDVRREAELKRNFADVQPDYTIDVFEEIFHLDGIQWV